MGIFADYKAYKQYEPQYASWKEAKDLAEAKKLAYLQQNPIDEATKNNEIQRGKALLNAIDIMDEYSQSRAENMEIATTQALTLAGQTANYVGMFLGLLATCIPKVRHGLDYIGKKFPKIGYFTYLLPIIEGSLAGMAAQMCLQGWAASKEVGASRKGRFEAMKNELSDVKKFAVLTDEQKARQEEIASKIPTTKDMKKGVEAKKSNMLNPLNIFDTIKDLVVSDKKFQKEREEFNKSLYAKADPNTKLSETDILKAKKDQQLLNNIIEKIDMASQDYAENVELTTQTLIMGAMAGGGLTGFIANKIIKSLKINSLKYAKLIPIAVGATVAVGSSVWAASVQKQASRIGRFVAKREIEQDLNNFVYVDNEKTDKLPNDIKVQKKERPNFFKFMLQLFKDNAEYKKHIKTKGVDNIKKAMALKDIELTAEQIQEAKRLQKNTFKAFNKLDEKSQQYAESVEAVGEVIAVPVGLASGLVGLGIGSFISQKLITSAKHISKFKLMLPPFLGALIGLAPAVLLNIHFTKEQKQASRVAHMLALNEMQDYKNFVDYENLTSIESKK